MNFAGVHTKVHLYLDFIAWIKRSKKELLENEKDGVKRMFNLILDGKQKNLMSEHRLEFVTKVCNDEIDVVEGKKFYKTEFYSGTWSPLVQWMRLYSKVLRKANCASTDFEEDSF